MGLAGAELLVQKIHGHVAVLAVAVCWHPLLSLRRAQGLSRRARWSCYAASALLTAAVALGWTIYPSYRLQVRQAMYLLSHAHGLAFEIKEHIGTFALVLTWAGAVVAWATTVVRDTPLVPAVRRLYGTAAVLSTMSALIGIYLASVLGFAYGSGP